jgi:hypothetical protein
MERRTSLPIRPKPLIATRTAIAKPHISDAAMDAQDVPVSTVFVPRLIADFQRDASGKREEMSAIPRSMS